MHESLLTGYFLFQFVLKSNWRYQNSMTISRFRIGCVLIDSFIILHYITRNLTYLLYILSIIFTIPFVLSLYFNLIFYIFTCYPDFYILFSLLYDSFLWISVLSFSRHPFI